MEKVLKSYLRRLTNLSASNRSLLLLRLVSDQFIDIHDFDYLLNKPSFSILEDLIAKKKDIPIADEVDIHDEQSNKISLKLKKLKRIEHFIYEERGSTDLYVGWPFVHGKFSDGTMVRCPLLFFPVTIEQKNRQWILVLRKNVNLTLNKTFLLAYSFYNQVKLDEDLLERVFDDFDNDSRIFRTSLYELFKDSNIKLHFNQETFIDKLSRFRNYLKKDFDKKEKHGELKIHPEAVLGIFPQAGSHLIPDYMHLLENESFQDIEEFFYSRALDKEDNPAISSFGYLKKIKEEQTFTPFKMDAYQENALKAIKKGNSMVVQGPPGTGKSQLICNLIADYIARGKNVLLVSQKRAALDVVYDRLDKKSLGDFISLMHDFKYDRKSIYEQISSQIDALNDYQQQNNSLDSIQLERQYLQASRKVDQISEELEEFKEALYDETECGRSAKELYLTSDIDREGVNLTQEYKHFHFSGLDDFLSKAENYLEHALHFDQETYPWRNRRSFKDYGINDLRKIDEIIKQIPQEDKSIKEKTKSIIGYEISLSESLQIYDKKDKINELIKLLKDGRSYTAFQFITEANPQKVDPLWLANQERVVLNCLRGTGIERSLSNKALGKFQEALHDALEVRKNPFQWIRWLFLSKEKKFLKEVLKKNDLKLNKQGLEIITLLIDNRLNFEHAISKFKNIKWLTPFPASYKKTEIQNWFYFQKLAVNAYQIFTSFTNFREYFPIKKIDQSQLKQQLEALVEFVSRLPQKRSHWLAYLTPAQILELEQQPENQEFYCNTLQSDFDALVEFDRISDNLISHEDQVLKKLIRDHSNKTTDEWIEIFLNSLKLAWIDHIEAKYPVLRIVSTSVLDKDEQSLQQAIVDKLKVSKAIILMKSRERTYRDLEYNRLNNRVTYRDLYHQVTKKRRIWPLRKLISNFPDEIFDLVPCWMASPESASAVFPMQQIFDLVIFDEASQCFSERGIPAMYRGRQVVIAGDSKQLQPNDLYKIRWEDDNDEDIPELELDSLLNLASQYLMKVALQGHYRSKTMELINFSNQHFYKGKLRVLPDYHIMNSKEASIEYCKVDGIWEGNTNLEEARRVVDLIIEQLEKDPQKEIGVVTFNIKQQGLIMDLLEDKAPAKGIIIPDSLFIKNIENVQGDEKDIIIFSISYAPDKKGIMKMRFGSLNIEGGENRLNVAITRAREKIYLVTSIFPGQLKIEGIKNEGPRLLKNYLQYAYEVSTRSYQVLDKQRLKATADWYLSHQLMKAVWEKDHTKYIFSEKLPFADLTIQDKDAYKALVLTDDDMYFGAVTVKDPHAYLPFSFSEKNWPYIKIYSREFWKNKSEIDERIGRFLSRLH